MNKCRLQMYKSTQTIGAVLEKDLSLINGNFKDRIGIGIKETISIKRINTVDDTNGKEVDI